MTSRVLLVEAKLDFIMSVEGDLSGEEIMARACRELEARVEERVLKVGSISLSVSVENDRDRIRETADRVLTGHLTVHDAA